MMGALLDAVGTIVYQALKCAFYAIWSVLWLAAKVYTLLRRISG